jgi:dTDP-4-dehydrorhamnose 3,5-epimerase
MNLAFTPTELPEVIHIQASRFSDHRGWLSESYNKETFAENGITEDFIQEKHSFSNWNVVRGLHFQNDPHAQGKLVRCSSGKIFDVAVDIRKTSPNYKKWIGMELSYEKNNMLYIPPGFAHGFYVLSKEGAGFTYLTTHPFNAESDMGIYIEDLDIGIDWPFSDMPLLISDKDLNMPLLKDVEHLLK